VLTKQSGTNYDTLWTPKSPLTTRGDLLRRGASDDERLALGASGKLLVSDGTDAVWGDPPTKTLLSIGIGPNVNNISTSASLLGGAQTLFPANSILLNDTYKLSLSGQWLNNPGSLATMTVQVVIGGVTTNLTASGQTLAASSNKTFWIEFVLSIDAVGVGATQGYSVNSAVTAAGATAIVLANTLLTVGVFSFDTTINQDFDVRIASNVNSSSNNAYLYACVLTRHRV
jgi:hypothetical protein